MMGQQAGVQDQLFYSFNLDRYIPSDHLLRGINQFLDLSALRLHLAGHCSDTGRPSIDPELMIRMLVIGYLQKQIITIVSIRPDPPGTNGSAAGTTIRLDPNSRAAVKLCSSASTRCDEAFK